MTRIDTHDGLTKCTYDPTDQYSSSVKVYEKYGIESMVELMFQRPRDKNTEVVVSRDEIVVYGPRDMIYEMAACLSELLKRGLL